MKNKKEKIGNAKEWIPIKEIKEDKIVLKNTEEIRILKIEPVNFKLKTKLEQKAILEGYKYFLKRCNFDIQIIIITQKIDIQNHIKIIQKNTNKEEKIKEYASEHINLLKTLSKEKSKSTKNYYIVVNGKNQQEKIAKIIDSLRQCENEVTLCRESELKEIVRKYLNKKMVKIA